MLNEVKTALRITHNALDDDISANITSALLDMSRVGVDCDTDDIESNSNNLLMQCAKMYCKWQYNFDGQGDKWQIAYEKLRDALSLCASYNGGVTDE